jgi:hypothetical protein
MTAFNLSNYAEVRNFYQVGLHQQRCTPRHLPWWLQGGFEHRACLLQGVGPHQTSRRVAWCDAHSLAMHVKQHSLLVLMSTTKAICKIVGFGIAVK